MTNINGYHSKLQSFNSIISSIKPGLVICNETQLKFAKVMNIPDYISFTRNRIGKSGGGISTSIPT